MWRRNVAKESASQDALSTGADIEKAHGPNASVRALGRVIARQQSLAGDAFRFASADYVKCRLMIGVSASV
jgi:hypothetical protein